MWRGTVEGRGTPKVGGVGWQACVHVRMCVLLVGLLGDLAASVSEWEHHHHVLCAGDGVELPLVSKRQATREARLGDVGLIVLDEVYIYV